MISNSVTIEGDIRPSHADSDRWKPTPSIGICVSGRKSELPEIELDNLELDSRNALAKKAPLELHCPSCRASLEASEASFGKMCRCPDCQSIFRIANSNHPQASSTTASKNDDKRAPLDESRDETRQYARAFLERASSRLPNVGGAAVFPLGGGSPSNVSPTGVSPLGAIEASRLRETEYYRPTQPMPSFQPTNGLPSLSYRPVGFRSPESPVQVGDDLGPPSLPTHVRNSPSSHGQNPFATGAMPLGLLQPQITVQGPPSPDSVEPWRLNSARTGLKLGCFSLGGLLIPVFSSIFFLPLFVLSVVGCVMAFRGRGNDRTAGMILNGVAIALALTTILRLR